MSDSVRSDGLLDINDVAPAEGVKRNPVASLSEP